MLLSVGLQAVTQGQYGTNCFSDTISARPPRPFIEKAVGDKVRAPLRFHVLQGAEGTLEKGHFWTANAITTLSETDRKLREAPDPTNLLGSIGPSLFDTFSGPNVVIILCQQVHRVLMIGA